MQRRPIHQFNVDTEVGLDKLPLGSLITCLNTGGATKSFQLVSKTGILSTTTIAQAVTGNQLTLTQLPAGVDSTELGYLNGVTSNLQTQLNNKAALQGTPTVFGGAKYSLSGTALTITTV